MTKIVRRFLRDVAIALGIGLLLGLALPQLAKSQDVQYSRDSLTGRLDVQINPGAGARGPYTNVMPIDTPGYTLRGSIGLHAPKFVQEFRTIPVMVPVISYAPSPVAVVTPPPPTHQGKPYMKICRHVGTGTVCKEFDMGE